MTPARRPWTAQLVQDAHRLHRQGVGIPEIATAIDIEAERVAELLWVKTGDPRLDPAFSACDTETRRSSVDARRGGAFCDGAAPPQLSAVA